MPYIKMSERERFRPALAEIERNLPTGAGELNYLLSSAVSLYAQQGNLNYARINEIVGVIEAVKLEFYRRVAAPYEDAKAEQNGDVYA